MTVILTGLLLAVIAGGMIMAWALCRIASQSDEMMEALALIALRRDLQSGGLDPSLESTTEAGTPLLPASSDPGRDPFASQRPGSDAVPIVDVDEVPCPIAHVPGVECLLCRDEGVLLVYYN